MKVLLLGFGKIAYMPYMNFYLETFEGREDIDFELIYWDRDGKPDAEVPAQIKKAYKFEAHLEEQLPFKKKLKFFLRYRIFALNVLRANRYDKIIVLHTTPGLTLLDYLRRHYRGRYVLDFRDVSYEYIPIYRKLVGKLAEGSAITYVSSDAFRKYLPDLSKIYTIHNFSKEALEHKMLRCEEPRAREVLRVCYWGLVRQAEVNKKVMDALGNDPRFELHYYGRMQQAGRDMEQYAAEKQYSNVFFHGQYMPDERYGFAKETDLIHNIYDLGTTAGNAMGNKFYDGVIFGIPQICTAGSYMGETVQENGVGLTIDLDSGELADTIWKYYQTVDWDLFEADCEKQISRITDEQSLSSETLIAFFCK